MLSRDDFTLTVRPARTDFSRADHFLARTGLDVPQVLAPGALTISAVRMSQITLLRAVSPSLSVLWHRRRSGASERRAFLLLEDGEVAVESASRDETAVAGSVLVIEPATDPVRFTFRGPVTRLYVLSAARSVLDPQILDRTGALTSLRPEHASFTGVMTALLGSTISSVRADIGPALSSGFGNILRAAANELSAQALRAGQEPLSTIDQALAMIRIRSDDAAFNAHGLALSMGVPLRTLQQRFADRGTSIAVEIRRSRVRSAAQMLVDAPRQSLDAVARRSGFANIAALRSGLRAELGTTPTDLRSHGARHALDLVS